MSATTLNPTPKYLDRLVADFMSVAPDQNVCISGVTQDSRMVEPGFLFLACRGESGVHGKGFIADAVAKGAVAVLLDVQSDEQSAVNELGIEVPVPVVPVEDLWRKVGFIAANFCGHPSREINVIAVTGTNGKTSCTQFIAQALNAYNQACGVIGTLGAGMWGQIQSTGMTTPSAEAVQMLLADLVQQQALHVAMEVSSHALVQQRIAAVEVDVAVMTNLSRDHLDYHNDMKQYAAAKKQLFKMPSVKSVVINLDDPVAVSFLAGLNADVQTYGYSLEAKTHAGLDYLLTAEITALQTSGMSLVIRFADQTAELQAKLMGRFNASNLLAVIASLLASGLTFSEAIKAVTHVQAPLGRMECFTHDGQPSVIVDYAHTPDALEKVLLTLKEHCSGELWVVFGCGGDRDRGKRPLMGQIAETYCNHVIVTDDNPRTESVEIIVSDILKHIEHRQKIIIEHDRRQAIAYAIKNAKQNDIVLVAGKGHEDYQIIGQQRRHFSDREVVNELLGVAA